MKLYRKVIPKIAKDVVRSLLANQCVEIEDGRRDEAELDVAAAIVDYLNQLDKVHNDAQDALQRHKLSAEMLGRIKRNIAETRKIATGDEALDFVMGQIIEAIFDSKNVEEVFAEDHEMRKIIHDAMHKYIGVDEELDREVRGRLRNLREGTAEWEVEYGRLIDQMRVARAL